MLLVLVKKKEKNFKLKTELASLILTTEVVVANEKTYIRTLIFFIFIYRSKFFSDTIELLSKKTFLKEKTLNELN